MSDIGTRRIEQDLSHFTQRLLEPLSLDALLAALPALLPEALVPGLEYRVQLGAPDSLDIAPLPEANWQVTLPLRYGPTLLGAVLVTECDARGASADWDEVRAGHVAALLAAFIDHHQRAAEREAQLHAEAAAWRSHLIGVLSHEMRTPLASIKGFASALLLDDARWDDETAREFLQAIDEETDRLSRFITGMLDSAVIEAGALRLEREPLLLPHMVRRAIEKLALRTDQHQLILSFPPDFPVVEADEQRIDRVLSNLLDNAVKYSPEGGLIVVSGRVEAGEVVISVADQGIGIAPEHLNKLFERFFRARGSGQQARVEGTGLGLPITDAIIRAHGGRIWAESTLGKGTTFSFTLPLPDEHVDTGMESE